MSATRILAIAAALMAVGCAAARAEPPAPFDKPLKTLRVALQPDALNPQSKPKVTCTYYATFMVKEVDLGEVGADQVSLLPISPQAKAPPCVRANAAGERVFPAAAWSGYFLGVRGQYIFLDGSDGWQGGMPFAVFTTNAKKLVDDTRIKWAAIATTPTGLILRYRRIYEAKCSLFSAPDTCWSDIKKDTGVTGTMPDCRVAYVKEQKRVPKFAKETADDPTVIDYDVVMTIDGNKHSLKPASGKAIGCRPSE
jgi:hypothetical protein